MHFKTHSTKNTMRRRLKLVMAVEIHLSIKSNQKNINKVLINSKRSLTIDDRQNQESFNVYETINIYNEYQIDFLINTIMIKIDKVI